MSRNNQNFMGFSFGSSQGKKASIGSSSRTFNSVPPPANLTTTSQPQPHSINPQIPVNKSKTGYATLESISQYSNSSQSYQMGRKRIANLDDDYFDDDEEPAAPANQLEYIPGPDSPTNTKEDSDEEEDPLDAFMAGLEKQAKKEIAMVSTEKPAETQSAIEDPKNKKLQKGVRGDIDDEDVEESYYRYMEENPTAGIVEENSDDEIEYDEHGNPIAPVRSRYIDPLPPIDHSEIEYQPFEKNFYVIHEQIAAMNKTQTGELRHKLGIKVTGPGVPHPVASFAHFGFDEGLMKAIRKSEYSQPTPIQAQAIPAALSGRDIIGIAKTGSGKTAAYLWPLLTHIIDQKELKSGDGPIGLILAPTRELSIQIYNEAKKFGKVFNIRVCCCYGGGSKWEQSKDLEAGAEIVVATPGRMIDMVKMKATNLQRCTYLVLDEADKMFQMGFEVQVRSIADHVRPSRQTLLFSATFKKRIEKLARDVLTDPVRIVQGDIGEANQDITQHAIVFSNPTHKWNWLLSKLVEFLSFGSVLIFVTKKMNAEELAGNLKVKEFNCLLLHGDIEQAERNKVITQFKKKEVDILVATDVASRGLDIPHIKNVINYDMARDIDTHTHRIGRTARAGEKGNAYTLVTDKDKEMVGHLVRNLEGANQFVPDDLLELAMQSSWFRKSRFSSGKGKSVNVGGLGFGFKERSNNKPGYSGPSSSGASGSSGSSSTPSGGTNRLTTLKEAFKAQYNNQFRTSSDKSWETTLPAEGVFVKPNLAPPPSSEDKKGKRSRWN